jgi:hypothetical protein
MPSVVADSSVSDPLQPVPAAATAAALRRRTESARSRIEGA